MNESALKRQIADLVARLAQLEADVAALKGNAQPQRRASDAPKAPSVPRRKKEAAS